MFTILQFCCPKSVQPFSTTIDHVVLIHAYFKGHICLRFTFKYTILKQTTQSIVMSHRLHNR